MFAGLDAVPWATFPLERGTARAMPSLLRQASSPDEDERIDAWQDLDTALLHPAAALAAQAAIPFLIEMLANPALSMRAEVAAFLCRLADGDAGHLLRRPPRDAGRRRPHPDVRVALARETPAYRRILDHGDDAGLRARVLTIMAALAPPPAFTGDLAGLALADPQPLVRAAASLLLGARGHADAGTLAALAALAAEDPDPFAHWCAAAAEVVLGGELASAESQARMASSLFGVRPRVLEGLAALDWEGDPDDLACAALDALPASARHGIIEGLFIQVDQHGRWGPRALGRILTLAMPPRADGTRQSLDALGRHAVEALLSRPHLWTANDELGVLTGFGLPSNRATLRAYLAADAGRADDELTL
jgi:hypothetical protein